MKKIFCLIIVLLLISCGVSKKNSSSIMIVLYDDAPMSGYVHRLELGSRKLSVIFNRVHVVDYSINIEGSVTDFLTGEPTRVNIAWLEQLSSGDYKVIRCIGMSDIDGHFNVPLPDKVHDEKLLIGFDTPGYMSKIYAF